MLFDASLAPLADILPLRELYRAEMNAQIIHDSWPGRGWTDPYLLRLDGRVVGYGTVGGVRGDPKDTITEFFLRPPDRAAALPLLRRLAEVSRATAIEAQTNDLLLTLMLFDCAASIERHAVLFHDAFRTDLQVPGAIFRKVTEADRARGFPADLDSGAEWLLEVDVAIVGAGGVLFHYNPPYGDVYMAVSEPFRRRGFGGYLVQELKRTCYERGKVPAARCSPTNPASRATLQKAGFLPCARVLTGALSI